MKLMRVPVCVNEQARHFCGESFRAFFFFFVKISFFTRIVLFFSSFANRDLESRDRLGRKLEILLESRGACALLLPTRHLYSPRSS